VKSYKLVSFDLDGCLTEKDDSWGVIHRYLGVWDRAQKHRQMFFAGEINYQKWADLDVGLWKNTHVNEIKKILRRIKVHPHIQTVVQDLKQHHLILVILSSGLSFFANQIKDDYNFDYAIANAPQVDPAGRLTGKIKVGVSFDDKDLVLQRFLEPLNIQLEECIAVGDGENDIPLFKKVGFSIAFNPVNDLVAQAANVVVREGDLLEVRNIILAQLKYNK